MSDNDSTVLLAPNKGIIQKKSTETEIKTYKRRWYILKIFSLVIMTQPALWSTWAPINDTANVVFQWNKTDLALMLLWGPLAFFVMAVPSFWILHKKGLGWGCKLSTVGLAVGAGVRCLAMIPPRKTWLIHMGQFITAWGGPMLFASPAVLSATWFPVEQQTLAISVGVTAGAVGQAVSFIIGPVFVPDSGSCQQNRSGHNISDIVTEHIQTISLENKNHNCSGDAAFIKDAGDGITKLLLVEFIWSVLLLLVTMLYFPARPPTPPSISASFEREDYRRGFLRALKSPKVYLIGFIYALPAAVFSMWANFIDVFLLPIGIQQDDAGWIGFLGIISAGISCIIVRGFIDHFKAWLKSSIVVLYCISIGSAVWFLLLCMKIIPFSLGMVYASFILTSAMMNSPQALMFELICQVCYPIGEATASGILCIIFNVVAIIYLILAAIEILGTAWLNWSLLVSVGVCVPPLALVSVNFKRFEVDKHGDKSE